MAAKRPKSALSIGVIEEASDRAAGDRASHDEPPSAGELMNRDSDGARDDPGDGAPPSPPERDQHSGEEDWHYEIDAVAAWIGDQHAADMAGAGCCDPDDRE